MARSQGSVKLEVSVPRGVVKLISDLLKFGDQTCTPQQFIEQRIADIGEDIMNDLSRGLFNHDDIRERYGL